MMLGFEIRLQKTVASIWDDLSLSYLSHSGESSSRDGRTPRWPEERPPERTTTPLKHCSPDRQPTTDSGETLSQNQPAKLLPHS